MPVEIKECGCEITRDNSGGMLSIQKCDLPRKPRSHNAETTIYEEVDYNTSEMIDNILQAKFKEKDYTVEPDLDGEDDYVRLIFTVPEQQIAVIMLKDDLAFQFVGPEDKFCYS